MRLSKIIDYIFSSKNVTNVYLLDAAHHSRALKYLNLLSQNKYKTTHVKLMQHLDRCVLDCSIRQNSDVSVTSVTLTLPRLYEVG